MILMKIEGAPIRAWHQEDASIVTTDETRSAPGSHSTGRRPTAVLRIPAASHRVAALWAEPASPTAFG